MQKPALAILGAQLVDQLGGIAALARAQGVDIPFGRIAVFGGHKRRLTAHGQPHIMAVQILVHLAA